MHQSFRHHIYYVSDIWKFTLYWCLILYPSAYIISGIITLYNLTSCAQQNIHYKTHKEQREREKQEGFLNFNKANDGSVIVSINESNQYH